MNSQYEANTEADGPREQIPPPVRDFLVQFAHSVKMGRQFEIQAIYERSWRDVSKKFYPNEKWPSVAEVAPLVKDDKNFLVLYNLLCYKHILTKLSTPERPASLATHVEAWKAYADFFKRATDPMVQWAELPSSWLYELLSEALFHMQQYQEIRYGSEVGGGEDEDGAGLEGESLVADGRGPGSASNTAASAASERRFGPGANPAAAQAAAEGLDEAALDAAWSLPSVVGYLYALVDRANADFAAAAAASASGAAPAPAAAAASGAQAATHSAAGGTWAHPSSSFRQQAGYFAQVCLCRVHAKLGDYASALEAAAPLNVFTGDGIYVRLPKCHVSLQYYVGFALLMSRRFEDALRVFSRTIVHFQRTNQILHDAGTTGSNYGVSFLKKQVDKMLAFIAIAAVVVPGAVIDEQVRKTVRERHGEKMERIAGGVGDADVEDIFLNAVPGFLTYTPVPRSEDAADAARLFVDPKHVYRSHLRLFKAEVAQRCAGMATLRSYLRLYTNIDVAKLALYCNITPDEARSLLSALKVKSWQTGGIAIEAPSATSASAPGSSIASTASAGAAGSSSSDPLHFYMSGVTVAVEETRQAFNITGFMLRSIDQLGRIAAAGGGGLRPRYQRQQRL